MRRLRSWFKQTVIKLRRGNAVERASVYFLFFLLQIMKEIPRYASLLRQRAKGAQYARSYVVKQQHKHGSWSLDQF